MKHFEFNTKGDKEPLQGESGICPYCESMEIKYGAKDDDEVGFTYEVQCNDCNGEWIESYEVQFSGNWGYPKTVKSNYEGGVCPDCGEAIPDSAVDGSDCSNCGHVFYS